jgi:hypothetical protein
VLPSPFLRSSYAPTLFAFALTFAHRFFAAFIIAALPAADKTRFFNRIGAMLALAKARKARSTNRLECRAFECTLCGKGVYHLTSGK